MCSDGEVYSDNAKKAHECWKSFVNNIYLKEYKITPFVETIGIGSNHDADKLSGFICNDNYGNYVNVNNSDEILNGFINAENEAISRIINKINIEFQYETYKNIL